MPSDFRSRGSLALGPERRAYSAEFEVRTLAGSKVELTGYASTTEMPYEMFDMFGSYEETVRSGAFVKTLSENPRISYLANHEGLTLASTTAGTLRCSEDSKGLLTAAILNISRSDARDLVTAVEDREVSEMSFAFRVVRQDWDEDFTQRSMVELNLDRGDVSAVNFGANPNTNVGLQRAFRSVRPAHLHRLAVEVREGKTLSASTAESLSKVLDLIASADDAVDAAQPILASLLGVPNPDDADEDKSAPDTEADTEADAARFLAFYDLERRREAERRRRLS